MMSQRITTAMVMVLVGSLLLAACAGQGLAPAHVSQAQPTSARVQAPATRRPAAPSAAGRSPTQTVPPTTDTSTENSPSGDIPDTATFLTYHVQPYSLQYVEGWTRQTLPNDGLRFADKDSFVSITLITPPPAAAALAYAQGQGATNSAHEFPQFKATGVKTVTLPSGQAALLTFRALSAPDAVTGNKVTLEINRYYIPGPQSMAVLTEATPVGVDTVDAFHQIAQSFAWSGQ